MTAPSTRTPQALGYVRVSTDQQVESGLGLEAQRATIEIAAARLQVPVAHIYEDAGLSGSLALEDRPGLLAATAALHRGDVLIVAKRDRLGRDVVAVALIERLVAKRGARVVSAAGEGTNGDGPTDFLLRTLVDAFAQYERLLIGARTAAALRAKKLRGERIGGIPFGCQLAGDGRTLIPNPDERQALGVLRELRTKGYTFRAIADELNRQGFRSRTGGLWVRQSVHLLSRAA